MASLRLLEPKRFCIVCDNCFVEITYLSRIRCAECPLDLCLTCFSEQIETTRHSKYHKYRVYSKMNMPVGVTDWNILESMLFFDGLESCGVGNWEDIGQFIGTVNNIEEHFYETFGFKSPNPIEEVQDLPKISQPYTGVISSYMPARKYFDTELVNDKELSMNNLSLSDNEVTDQKLYVEQLLASYKIVVYMRLRRNHFIADRNLFDMNRLKKLEEESYGHIIKKYKPLAPYLTKQDFNTFIKGLIIEEQLSNLIVKIKRQEMESFNSNTILNAKNLLSDNERRLCHLAKIPSTLYMDIKREVLPALCKGDNYPESKIKKLFGLKKSQLSEIRGIFMALGYSNLEVNDESEISED